MFKTKKYKAIIGLAAIVSCALGVRTYAMESLKTHTHTATYLNSLTSDTKAIVEMTTKLREKVNFSEISKTPGFEDIAICFLFQSKNFLKKFEELINIFEYTIPPAPAIDLDKNKPYNDNTKPYLMNIALQRIPGNPQDIQTKLKNFYSYIKDICELKLIDFEELDEELKDKFENLKKSNKLNFINLLNASPIRMAGVDFPKIYKTITQAELEFPTFFTNNENTQSINKETTNYNDIYIHTFNHLAALYEFFNELFNKLIEFYSNNPYIKERHANIKNGDYDRLVQIIYSIRNSFMAPKGAQIQNKFYQQMYDRIRREFARSSKPPIYQSAQTFVQNASTTTIPTLNGIIDNSPVDYFSSTNPNNLSNSKKQLSDLDHKAMQLYKDNSVAFALDAYNSLYSTVKVMLDRYFFPNKDNYVYPLQGIALDKIQHLISSIPQFLKLYQADNRVYHNPDICKLDNDSSMADYVKKLDSIKNTIPLLALFYIFIECCYYARSTLGFQLGYFNTAFEKIKKFIFEPNKTTDNPDFVNTLSECFVAIKKTILRIILHSKTELATAGMSYDNIEHALAFSDSCSCLKDIVPEIEKDISSLSNTTNHIFSNIISTAKFLMHLQEYFLRKTNTAKTNFQTSK